MKLFRTVLFCSVLFLLAAGYLASQYAYLNGNSKDYAAAVDTPAIQGLSLALLALCIALPFIKFPNEKPDDGEESNP